MKLLMVRHGKTVDRLDWQAQGHEDDFERPMTSEGVKEFQSVARHLSLMVSNVDCIVSSPFKRTMQTAKILQEVFSIDQIFEDEALLQKSPVKQVYKMIKHYAQSDKTLVIVGHEGHFTQILSALIGAEGDVNLRFKKGGCALLKLEIQDQDMDGMLQWFLPPKLIRKVAKV